MPLILPGNVGSATASTGFDVANSCRFNKGSSDFLNRTPSSAGSLQKYTFSCWVKRSTLGANASLFGARVDANTNFFITFRDDDDLYIKNKIGGTTKTLITNRVFRDPSAWYHVVVAMDTTQGTASNRTKIYINGVQETSFSTEEYPAQNGNTAVNQTVEHNIGDDVSDSGFFNGYIAEAVFINNAQLAPTSFGEFDSDSGIWKPIDVSGLTFGNNGVYLDFENSGALGADVSGNGNNFTVNNLTAADQSTDTCTNNFATLNILNNYWAAATFSEGNTVYTSNNTGDYYGVATSTIGVSKGKWYFEAKNSTNTDQGILGITSRNQTSRGTWLGSTSQAYGYYSTGGVIRSNSQDTSYGASYTANDIIGIYLDLDNNKMYVSDNGALQNSGTGHSITAAASTDSGFYHLAVGDNSDNTQVWQCNFGGTSGFAISSGNTDDNGYGNFEYSPNITGDSVAKKFYALCSKNLAEFG